MVKRTAEEVAAMDVFDIVGYIYDEQPTFEEHDAIIAALSNQKLKAVIAELIRTNAIVEEELARRRASVAYQ